MKSTKQIERISILWAMTECGLGGFFHAIQSPFTGLIVGGLSVIYISLIALSVMKEQRLTHLHRGKRVAEAIFKSLVFVLLIKAIVSPHSPVGAYFAVSMQALLGIIFYSVLPSFRLAAFLTGFFATVLSAIQKLLILWLLFGTPFFEALDKLILTNAEKMDFIAENTTISTTYYLALIFISVYAIGGAYIGWITGLIPSWLEKQKVQLSLIISEYKEHPGQSSIKKQSKHWMPFLFGILFTLALTIDYYLVSPDAAWSQFLRTTIILSLWFLLVSPFLRWSINRYASKHEKSLQDRIAQINEEIPRFIGFIQFAWSTSNRLNGYRLNNFILLILHFGLNE